MSRRLRTLFVAAVLVPMALVVACGGDDDADGSEVLPFSEVQAIAGVEFLTRSMADGTAITTTFTVIADGGEHLGPFEASTPAQPAVHVVDVEAQELRFDVENSTGGNTGAIEVRIYAPE